MAGTRRDMDPRIELIERMRIKIRENAAAQIADIERRKAAVMEWLDLEELRVAKSGLTGGLISMVLEEDAKGPKTTDTRTGEVTRLPGEKPPATKQAPGSQALEGLEGAEKKGS